MRVTIRNVLGLGIKEDLVVPATGLLIGRSLGCELRPSCPTVSRIHCELTVNDSYVAIRDLNSKNGTFVNNRRVTEEQQLASGDRIYMGRCVFEVDFDQPELASETACPVVAISSAASEILHSSRPLSDHPGQNLYHAAS
jgi:pSer/pThr/pTyr-binding forkhead associated (FHA) protein